jgi:hypothetical protein
MSTVVESLQINQSISLYIPRISTEITKEQIAYVFESNLFGEVSRVDLVSKTDYQGNYYNATYIHFKEWKNSIMVHHFQEKLVNYMNGITITPVRVVYDDPYYWNVFINNSTFTQHVSGSGQKKICLDLSDFYASREKEMLEKLQVVEKNEEKITTNEMGAYLLSVLRNNSCEKCK